MVAHGLTKLPEVRYELQQNAQTVFLTHNWCYNSTLDTRRAGEGNNTTTSGLPGGLGYIQSNSRF